MLSVWTALATVVGPHIEPPPGPGKPAVVIPGPLEQAEAAARRALALEQARQEASTADHEHPLLNPTPAEEIGTLAGDGSMDNTEARFNIIGADLGHLFWHDGSLHIVFGDTYGTGTAGWRSNTMGRIADPDPANGLPFANMVMDDSGQAGELLTSEKVDGIEHTVIPTFGASVGDRMVLHYMSIRVWGPPGRWEVNHSGLAYSDDGGRTWQKHETARWPATSNFAQVAITEHQGKLYFFGLPAGRFGGLNVARVDPGDVLDIDAYRYWDGEDWIADPASAITIVQAPVGELSVEWSPYLDRWLMLYLDETLSAIVVRSAAALTGPWSPVEVVATANDFPTLYAPYIVPGSLSGPDVYFTMSRFSPYAVYLMHTTLRPARATISEDAGSVG